jgi:hypothetical protein
LCLAVVTALAAACSKEPAPSTPATPAAPDATKTGDGPQLRGDVPPGFPGSVDANTDPSKPLSQPVAPAGPTSNDPKDYPGLKIESLKAGDGKELVAGKKAKVRYIGTLTNGKEFDSSWKRSGTEPAEFALDGVVPGFRVGLLGMKVGEQRRVTIPGEFGYKEAGSPGAGIGPNETLIFDVELVDVVD